MEDATVSQLQASIYKRLGSWWPRAGTWVMFNSMAQPGDPYQGFSFGVPTLGHQLPRANERHMHT